MLRTLQRYGGITKTHLSIILFLASVFLGANIAIAQKATIKVRLEIDGQEVRQPFKVLLSVKGGTIFEPSITDGSFVFPAELRSYEKVNLQLLYKAYELNYGDIYLSKFNGEMVFGIDKKPFDEKNIPSSPLHGKELILIYYIKFAATELLVHVYK